MFKKLVCLFKGHLWSGRGQGVWIEYDAVVGYPPTSRHTTTRRQCIRCGRRTKLIMRCDEQHVLPSRWERDEVVY